MLEIEKSKSRFFRDFCSIFFPTLDVVLRAKHALISHGRRRRAEIALGFCSQQQVVGSICCPPFSWRSARPIRSACGYADNSASTSDAADADQVGAGAPSMASSTYNRPVRAFFAGGGCGVLAGGFHSSNRDSSIAHCLIASSLSGAKRRPL